MYLKDKSVQVGKDVLVRFPRKVVRFFEFMTEMKRFRSHPDNRFRINLKDVYPCLSDKSGTTPFDQHYTYHPAWAARIIARTKPEYHVDFSSILYFGTMLSAFIPVKFYDYRPAELSLSNWEGNFADLCKLDIADNSFESVSCMHTIEHVGLGRYGDKLDPTGDMKAASELVRVTRPGGNIFFVTPVGQPRIEFNGHRIYSYQLVMDLFNDCELQEFSMIPDAGGLIEHADPELVKDQRYACGCFWFKKK